MNKKKKTPFVSLIQKIEKTVNDRGMSVTEKLWRICGILKESVPHYDWVGFYLVDRAKKNELVLGPYVGDPTVHTRIPFGRGICGQAAATKKMFLVQDVSKETNYLACSAKVKSEVVLPIFKGKEIVGELDIDSHTESAFEESDTRFLQQVCDIVSQLF
jgi:GAF domain-containing protein